ncbi:DUF2092 domain-containing protein [Chamaesiphon minutus]|uniref:Outer membrane lipoprotein-sorting protein n=1 Tax=Chamaesiphon minutus (strain ATCC 27169 / PCC 6605) TaxID=1173020 RepID=K9UEC2_CHAP6|nr:DUF2092 domain-containing protein [Chamaesiphon minutus]AFY93467.1 hypothetical protein Cha6605_2407 [Chamaesiphon minutus PCC 6605]
MSKFLSEIVMAAMLVSLTGNVHAQIPSTPTATPSTLPTATTPDLKLLGKAMGVFWQGNRAQTDSQIVMTLQRKGTKANPIQINATVKTIAQTGEQFRSELTVSRSGSPLKITYSIVCDGKNVWMYRPDKRQYAQTTFAEFKPQFHSLLVGLSTVFFVSMPESGRKSIVAEIAAGVNPVKSLPPDQTASLQGNMRQVEGQNLYVYTFDNKDEGSSFSGYVQPETGILKQIELINNTAEGEIKVVEKISSHTTTTNLSTKTFKFSPPPRTKKVQSLSNDLLQLIQ